MCSSQDAFLRVLVKEGESRFDKSHLHCAYLLASGLAAPLSWSGL